MARYTRFGNYLRQLRQRRKVRSAAELGRRANLSASHIAMFERGEVLPRWRTAARLADALRLHGPERDDFFRAIDAAAKPRSVRQSTEGLAIPNLAVWKHLPAALYRVRHDLPGLAPVQPDRVLAETVPAAGALLAWAELLRKPPNRKQRQAVRDQVARAIDEERPTGWPEPLVSALRTPVGIASAIAPDAWQSLLFATDRATVTCASRLRHWRYASGVVPIEAPVIGFTFKDRQLRERCSVDGIESELIVRLHNALALDHLWAIADLAGLAKGEPEFDYYSTPTLHVLVDKLLSQDLDAVRAKFGAIDWQSPTEAVLHVVELVSHVRLVRIATFVQRVRERRAVARWLLGSGWPGLLKRILDRARTLEQVLRETTPAASTAQPPSINPRTP